MKIQFSMIKRDPFRVARVKAGETSFFGRLDELRDAYLQQFPDSPAPTRSEILQQVLDSYIKRNGELPELAFKVEKVTDEAIELPESLHQALESGFKACQQANPHVRSQAEYLNALLPVLIGVSVKPEKPTVKPRKVSVGSEHQEPNIKPKASESSAVPEARSASSAADDSSARAALYGGSVGA